METGRRVRDPAFYQSSWTEQSDTPEHEGPIHHGIVELWQYAFPLRRADEAKLAQQLHLRQPGYGSSCSPRPRIARPLRPQWER